MRYSDKNHLQLFTILYKYKDCNYKHFRLNKNGIFKDAIFCGNGIWDDGNLHGEG